MLNIFRRAIVKRGNSVEANLRRHRNTAQSLGSAGLFTVAAGYKLGLKEAFPDGFDPQALLTEDFWRKAYELVSGQPTLVLLIGAVVGWYFLYMAAVDNEMGVLRSLYSDDNLPNDWERTYGRRRIVAIAILVPLTFFALVLTADIWPVFCAIMLLLNVVDAHANNILRRNLTHHFSAARYDPPDTDWKEPYIRRRREIALDYWVQRPQIERIGAMMMGTAVVIAISAQTTIMGVLVSDWVPAIGIVLIIFGNELTMGLWRTERDRRLDAVQDDEDAFDLRRLRGVRAADLAAAGKTEGPQPKA
ncbi:MAG: hypothetical protein ACKVPY_01090 [Paracoccaceae bacterium]